MIMINNRIESSDCTWLSLYPAGLGIEQRYGRGDVKLRSREVRLE
jgi:hypothetical protein